MAAQEGHIEIVRLLLAHEADHKLATTVSEVILGVGGQKPQLPCSTNSLCFPIKNTKKCDEPQHDKTT